MSPEDREAWERRKDERANAMALARYRALTGALPRAMCCGLCKLPGHDRRRCGAHT